MLKALALLLALIVALVAAPAPRAARAQDAPQEPVPVTVAATIDDADLATTGLFTIRLDFAVAEDVGRALSVVVELAEGRRVLLGWNHSPTPPPVKWKKGDKVHCDLPAVYPTELVSESGLRLDVRLAFRDDATGALLLPRDAVYVDQGRALVAELTPPTFEPVTDEQHVARLLAAADAFVQAGRRPDAWAALEFGLRGAPDDVTKYRLRNAMAKLGDFPARPLTEVEERIVAKRIEDERRRYLRQASGRLYDRQQYHGALRILESIGGKLQEDADAAVVGALADAKRVEKDLQDIREKILERSVPADKEDADKATEALGRTRALLDKARAWIREGRFAAARRLLKDLEVTGGKDVGPAAFDEVRALDKRMLAAIPPEEQAAADEALHHPAFARTAVSLSHEFVFIGPKTLVDGVPPGSRTAFDLAYVFLTDLFGRRPNPEGDRVTVYFKELWEFGGGVGGGKTIDIGSAKPDARNTTVDNGLLFHELTHCVDDTVPIHAGFREGLADFGAAYCHEALGRFQDASRAIAAATTAFEKDYVARDLEYWRIPNYGPSAGFFLHFAERYAKGGPNGHDWRPWRRFFREYRGAPVRDGREPYLSRVLAHHLVRAFGPGAFDDLVGYRFPLVASDRDAVAKEVDAFASGGEPQPEDASEFEPYPNSPLPRDLAERRMIAALRNGDETDALRIGREELGIVRDWHVIGPFEPQGADPGAQVFPPEHEVDFAKEYPQRMNIAKWRVAGEPGPVQIDALGWVAITYGYMDDTATYALTHVTAAADGPAFVHVRADDDFTLFVNGERVDDFVNRGWNDSTQFWWRGPVEHAPDAMRLRVPLRAGRNAVLLKIRNRGGPAGFVLAVSAIDGKALPGMTTDLLPPAPSKPVPEPKWRTAAKIDFKTKAALQKLDFAAGGLEVTNKLASGTSTAKGVQWRKYTVRPGFPKDSPSNLLWLKAKDTDGVSDFRLTVALQPKKGTAPKLAVTFQGEGGNDGLSGWNLLLWNAGGKVAGQVERYEGLVWQWSPVPLPEKETDELVLTYVARRLTVTLNGAALLTGEPIRPIPGRSRIGISTWGAEPRFLGIELETP